MVSELMDELMKSAKKRKAKMVTAEDLEAIEVEQIRQSFDSSTDYPDWDDIELEE